MNVRRAALGAWICAIALLAVACGAGTDQDAAGADKAPAAPTTTAIDDGPDTSGPDRQGPATTKETLAAMKAMDPDVLASLHDHEGHTGHAGHTEDGPALREGLNSVDPARIVIPAIGVDETIGRAGIDADGQMDVPDFGDTAWFTPSVKPGRVGPSVITGHVDSKQGPDVFFDLKDLEAGDEIEVHGQDGEVVVFAVDAVEQHKKDDYPRDRVHGATDGPELRLITCGGIFDRAIGHYDDNIIVFAERLAT